MQPQLAEGENFLSDQNKSLSAEGLKFCFMWPALKKKLKRTFIRRPADRDPAAEGQADSQPGERPQGQAAGGGWPPREDQEVGDDLSKRICWKRMILRLYFLLSSFEKRFPCRLEQEAGSYQRMIEVRHQFLDNQ